MNCLIEQCGAILCDEIAALEKVGHETVWCLYWISSEGRIDERECVISTLDLVPPKFNFLHKKPTRKFISLDFKLAISERKTGQNLCLCILCMLFSNFLVFSQKVKKSQIFQNFVSLSETMLESNLALHGNLTQKFIQA